MSVQDAIDECLTHLYQIYQSTGRIGDITPIAVKYNLGVRQLAKLLEERGLIRNKQVSLNNVRCYISWAGIETVDPSWVESNVSTIISTAGLTGGRQSLAQILQLPSEESYKIMDLGKHLAAEGLIEAVQYSQGDVRFDLSLSGLDYYERNKARFTDGNGS